MPVERSTQEARSGITGTGSQIMNVSPTITTPKFVNHDGDTSYVPHFKTCTTQFDAVTGTTGATLTNIVGLTGITLAAGKRYNFEIELSTVGTTNSGVKIGFALTTATLTSIEYKAIGNTATAVAVSRGTTATSGTAMFGATTATISVRIVGSLVVNAAGTIAIQAAQNAAHADTTSVFVGSWARFTRVN